MQASLFRKSVYFQKSWEHAVLRGVSSLSPLSRSLTRERGPIPGLLYGILPSENTSRQVTPYDHVL